MEIPSQLGMTFLCTLTGMDDQCTNFKACDWSFAKICKKLKNFWEISRIEFNSKPSYKMKREHKQIKHQTRKIFSISVRLCWIKAKTRPRTQTQQPMNGFGISHKNHLTRLRNWSTFLFQKVQIKQNIILFITTKQDQPDLQHDCGDSKIHSCQV